MFIFVFVCYATLRFKQYLMTVPKVQGIFVVVCLFSHFNFNCAKISNDRLYMFKLKRREKQIYLTKCISTHFKIEWNDKKTSFLNSTNNSMHVSPFLKKMCVVYTEVVYTVNINQLISIIWYWNQQSI